MKTTLQQLLAELQAISPQIRLTLPTSRPILHRQIQALNQTEQRLATLQSTNLARLHSSLLPSTRLIASGLTELVLGMMRDIHNLKHLAEEFPIDPEGTLACLRSEYATIADLPSRWQRCPAIASLGQDKRVAFLTQAMQSSTAPTMKKCWL